MTNILIIGCGLIGSSIVRAANERKITQQIFVYEKSKKNISKIKKLKLPCVIIDNFKNITSNLDLAILCTPMSEYEKIILKINKYFTAKTIITDVGSAKVITQQIIRKKLKKNLSWISSHPISGSEVSGPEFGDKDLFLNKWCILIKDKNLNKESLKFVTKFWKKLGSKTALMSEKKHDSIFAITSHLPHLIAYNLVKTATDFEKMKKYNLIKFSAGGLRDFSRIAASNEIMWRDIFFNNKKNILKVIDLFIKNLSSFKKDIKKKDNKKLVNKLVKTKNVRKKIILLKQDVNKPDFGRS